MAKYTLADSSVEFSKVVEYLRSELSKLRSGRANTDLVKDIRVMVYGQSMPIDQLANINVVDPTLLSVEPWDKSILKDVEKAIASSGLGINPVVDGERIRLPLPPLTQERREEYVKILKNKLEEARISIRQIRQDILSGLDERKKKGDLSEDEIARDEKELQAKVDEVNQKIEAIKEEKEKELMTV